MKPGYSPGMPRITSASIGVLLTATMLLTGCEEEKAEEVDKGPLLGMLELPVSLRNANSAPSNFHKIEVSPDEVRLNGETLIKLTSGKAEAGDMAATELPKLTAALGAPARGVVALEAHSQVPYWTISMILGSAAKAGISTVAIHVRKPTGGADDGWFEIKGFAVAPASPDEADVEFKNVQKRSWSDFTAVWEDVYGGCRAAMSGNCAFKPENIAEGGFLKMVLMAAGQGINVNFYRTGVTEEEDTEAAKAEKKPKVEMLDGITDPVAALEQAPPATLALFQFRARDVMKPDSPVAETIKPLCGSNACGVIVKAERRTMIASVVGMLGAAFPDGTAAPTVGFEVPAQ